MKKKTNFYKSALSKIGSFTTFSVVKFSEHFLEARNHGIILKKHISVTM